MSSVVLRATLLLIASNVFMTFGQKNCPTRITRIERKPHGFSVCFLAWRSLNNKNQNNNFDPCSFRSIRLIRAEAV
jgi:hypothetical protein